MLPEFYRIAAVLLLKDNVMSTGSMPLNLYNGSYAYQGHQQYQQG